MFQRSPTRWIMALSLALLLAVVVPGIALADDGSERGSIFSSVRVLPGETINGDVFSIFSNVDVEGNVTGSVFSIFSSVRVAGSGRVQGEAFSIFSNVTVRGNAVVEGDAFSIFSSVDKDASARVLGSTFSAIEKIEAEAPGRVDMDWADWGRLSDWSWRWGFQRGGWTERVFGRIFDTLLLAVIGVIVAVLFPRRVEVVRQTMSRNLGASLGVGVLGLILSVPLALLLIITCIGPFLLGLGVFVSTLLGLTSLGQWIGERAIEQASGQDRSTVTDVFVGLLILGLIMAVFFLVPYFWWMYYFVWFGVLSAGFGAVLLSRWGAPIRMAQTQV